MSSKTTSLHVAPKTLRDPAGPTHADTIIRIVMIFECCVNFSVAGTMLWAPQIFVEYLVSDMAHSPAVSWLIQFIALDIVALTFPLLLCIPSSAVAVERRRLVYSMHAFAELLFIGFLWWSARQGVRVTGMRTENLRALARKLILPMVGRIVMLWGSFWLGRWKGVGKDVEGGVRYRHRRGKLGAWFGDSWEF